MVGVTRLLTARRGGMLQVHAVSMGGPQCAEMPPELGCGLIISIGIGDRTRASNARMRDDRKPRLSGDNQ